MRTRARLVGLLLTAVSWTTAASAQDAHYWTYGYGPIGQLTEGTLVGGVSDMSFVYYNPAACALLDKPRFVINLTSIELANIDVPGAAGAGLDFDQLVFDIVPAMVAFHAGSHENSENHVALTFLSRHDMDFDLGYSQSSVSASSPNAVAGYGRFRQRVVEYWFGGSWSRRVGARASVGVSPFVAYRGQRARRALMAEEVAGSASRLAAYGSEHEYNHVRVLAKAGFAYRPGAWELGATLTTPGVGLWSTGKAVLNASAIGVPNPTVAASSQTGLEATYRAPWSVAAGATRRFGRGAVHTTVEWFSSVDPYDILQPEPAPVAGRPETLPLTYTGAADSVVNYGAGIEYRLSDRFRAYGGVARNHSAYVPRRDSFASWDLTDVTGGFTFDRGRTRFALGAGYAWGEDAVQQVIVPPGAGAEPPLRPARFSRWTISFGASLAN